MLKNFKITDMEAAKNETWFHPTKGRTVCIANIAETMTDAEAEMFMKGGCKVIVRVEDTAKGAPAKDAASADRDASAKK